MYNTNSQEWTQLSLPDSPKNPLILSVLFHDENVWFGGVNGVWRYSIADKQMQQVTDGLQKPSVNVLLFAENMLWAGTQGGLAKYDSTQQRWIPVSLGANLKEQLPPPNVTALAFHEGVLWVGTTAKIGKLHDRNRKVEFPFKTAQHSRHCL